MTKKIKIIIAIIIVILLGLALFLFKDKLINSERIKFDKTTDTKAPIVGCYAVDLLNDKYNLKIDSQEGQNFEGSLSFVNTKNEISTNGTFSGTYKQGILLGNYKFKIENTDYNLQLIFRKNGNDFVKGEGETNASGDTIVKLRKVKYNPESPLTVFKSTACTDSI